MDVYRRDPYTWRLLTSQLGRGRLERRSNGGAATPREIHDCPREPRATDTFDEGVVPGGRV